ncbi:E3 ubiquitin-protein ligase rnf146 isoform X1 [Harmonia axyridis]|uniref:E3 ubiquitin-protein ligase rnf146 isoform X1 n=1 Tax=Harmonia axyridis TaxID=115357 RepID=UPI001E278F0B|nr:E3 ubiquitin-protein ligase rnf146 isoform X1 [Harmonia axyridis]
MAESNVNESEEKKDFDLECAICLQPCVHPAELPCGHIFCFLCVKGIVFQNKRCALCRQVIPREYINNPTLVKWSAVLEKQKSVDDQYQWFYEGHNGWWQYDERTGSDLETAYNMGVDSCEVLISGYMYVIDFKLMVQYRKYEFSRKRSIKRDSPTIPKKGIAGIRTEEGENNCEDDEQNSQIENQIPITPFNTPQSPISQRQSPEDSFLQAFRSLRIGSPDTRNTNDDYENLPHRRSS